MPIAVSANNSIRGTRKQRQSTNSVSDRLGDADNSTAKATILSRNSSATFQHSNCVKSPTSQSAHFPRFTTAQSAQSSTNQFAAVQQERWQRSGNACTLTLTLEQANIDHDYLTGVSCFLPLPEFKEAVRRWREFVQNEIHAA